MSIITKPQRLCSTWIYFSVDDVTAWIVEELPQPSVIYYSNGSWGIIGWRIDGVFNSDKAEEFLKDAIARLSLTLKASPIDLPAIPGQAWEGIRKDDERVVELRELVRNCQSIRKHRYAPARADNFDDYTFWAIKLWVEDEIRRQGEGAPIIFERLQDWALLEFPNKERSTVRAKCRSIWRWYDARGWTIPKRNERKWKMTRSERAKTNSKAKAEKSYKAVVNTITGIFADEYKKKSGRWHIGKIAKATGLGEKTVSKHLKAFERNSSMIQSNDLISA